MPDLAKLVDDLSALSVIEAAQLSKMLEDKWGVSAAAPGSRENAIAVGPVNSGDRGSNAVPASARRTSRFLVTL